MINTIYHHIRIQSTKKLNFIHHSIPNHSPIYHQHHKYSKPDTNPLSMTWLTHGKDNKDMVSSLFKHKIIKSTRVKDAMLAVDRGDFVDDNAYEDSPQRIGYGATISAPHMHAFALEALMDNLKPGMSALDVGSGSGYLSAAMAHMVGEKGKVIGIDHMSELVEFSIANVNKHNGGLLKSKNLQIIHGDGRKGYLADAPYDAIHVGAAATKDIPSVLVKQLKNGGKMVIPVEESSYSQSFKLFTKSSDGKTVDEKDLFLVRYVPLTDESKQRKNHM